MIHWESFEAVHYRGIDGLSLSNLGHANLITGANGAGKTALIEAMWLLTGRHNPVLLWNQNVQRSALPVTNPISVLSDDLLELHGREGRERRTWKAVYRPVTQGHADPAAHGMMETNGENKPMPIPLAGRIDTWIDGTPVKETQSTSTPNGVVLGGGAKPGKTHAMIEGTRGQLEIPDEYLQRYSDLVREGRKEDLTRAIGGLILPRIKGLEILTDESGKSYVSASTSNGDQLPLQALGGGVLRLFRLYLSFGTARDGMVLVDEIENGIHHSVLQDLWARVRTWIREWRLHVRGNDSLAPSASREQWWPSPTRRKIWRYASSTLMESRVRSGL